MILITGAAGFIGRRVQEELLARGDRFETCDLQNGRSIFDLSSLDRYKAVIHLAAVSSVQASIDNPYATYKTNILGTQHLLNLRPKKIIFASSGSVVDPISPYALSKQVGEQIIRLSGVPYCILRLANVYGGGDDKSAIKHFLADDRITIHGDGSQIRSFVHVSDVARAFGISVAFSDAMQLGYGGTWNIGHELYSINEVAQMFGKAILYGPAKPGETHTYDIKFDGMPGWTPRVSLEQWVQERV